MASNLGDPVAQDHQLVPPHTLKLRFGIPVGIAHQLVELEVLVTVRHV